MMADSGASVNLLAYTDYCALQNPPPLTQSTTGIYAYGEKPIETEGEFMADLRFKNRSCRTTLIVAKDSSNSLLSWETSQKLQLLATVNTVKNNSEQIIEEFSELFTGLGKLKDFKVKLHIDETVQPVAQTHRRIPFHVRQDVEAQLKEDEDKGVIQRPNGPTPWVSPIVCVPKKNGKVRVCVDMRCANKAIKRERHSTPTISEMMNDLNGATMFSKLDLNQGYNQLELDDESRYITTFATHVGLRQFTRLNFGVCSAAEVFQEAIRQTLSGLDGVLNISDDILVFGKTQAEHSNNLRAVLTRLKEKGLTLSKDKCEFNKTSLEFFGHVFSSSGLSADPSKIKAVLEMDVPKSASEVRSLLGMTNYCGSRFVQDYATLTHELRELTKKNVQFVWLEKHQQAFHKLQQALTEMPVLQYFNPKLQTEVVVDASPVGLSAILVQIAGEDERHIVQYASRALTPVEQRYSQTEREALAIMWACEHLNMFVMGQEFDLYTDHKPLLPMFNNPKSKPPARIERWMLRMQPYQVNVKYRPGANNPADYLSRHTPSVIKASTQEERRMEEYVNYIATTSVPKAMTLAEIEASTEHDAVLKAVITAMKTGNWRRTQQLTASQQNTFKAMEKIKHELTVTESGRTVLRGSRIVIPNDLQQRAIDLGHVGHQGIVKTKSLIREKIWFSGIDSMVENTIRGCMACQVATPTITREPLKMSPLPRKPWSEISMDFGQVPGLAQHFMVISDDYSRYVIVEPVSSLSARAVIPILDKVIGQFGVPDIIKSDNGSPFNSKEFAEYASHKGFKHRKITPVWPLANAEAERFMKTVKKTMKAAISENKSWNQGLHSFLLNYRATPHTSTGKPPATLMFGRSIKTSLPQLTTKVQDRDVRQKDATSKAKMKHYADRKSNVRESKLKVGDPVLRKNEGKRKSDTPYDPKPFLITEKKGSKVTAERDGQQHTRNSSYFKPSPLHPDQFETDDVESDEIESKPIETERKPDVRQQQQQQQQPQQQQPQPQQPQPSPPSPPKDLMQRQQPTQTPPQRRQRPQRTRRMPAKFKDFVMQK